MKNAASVVLAIALLISSAVQLLKPSTAFAQASNGTLVLLQVGAPSACAWPAGATVTNGMAICGTTSGLYYSTNGSATFNPVAAASGVTSFNTRTGAVVPAANDYTYAQLSAKPTTLSCTTAQIGTGSTGTLTASGCTIQ